MEILGPARNRPLSISDESETLSSLFKRSATLVLVPTQSVISEAYHNTSTAKSGYGVHGVLSQAYAMISGAVNVVWSFAPFASGTVDPPPPPPPRREGRRVGTADSNVRTLGSQNDDSERRYYNGNQVSQLLPSLRPPSVTDSLLPHSQASSQNRTTNDAIHPFLTFLFVFIFLPRGIWSGGRFFCLSELYSCRTGTTTALSAVCPCL